MAKTKVTPDQVQALVPDATQQLIRALVEAINQTKPVEKKTAANRKPKNAWTPKDGSPKLKLKRKMYQHGIPIDPDMETNEVVDLLNRVKPGRYLDGWVKVFRRRDKGVDIDYPIKTSAQRLKLSSQFGITSFKGLLERCIEESNNPAKYAVQDDENLD